MLCYTAYFDFVVSVDGELLGLELLGLELLEEAPPLLDWSLEPDALGVEDELEELGELGVVVLNDPLALPLEESRLELELEPDGEDGDVPDAPLEEPERDAPGPLALSHP
jgi:hypothetical protein